MGSQRVRWIRIPPGHKSVGNPAHIEHVTPADRCGAPFELHLLRFEVVGGPGGGEVLVETDTRIGEPVGKTFDPPLDMTDVGTVRLTS